MQISEEQDELIDIIKVRLENGVSTERLLNNKETKDITMAAVMLRDHNVELATHLLQLSKRYDEVVCRLTKDL